MLFRSFFDLFFNVFFYVLSFYIMSFLYFCFSMFVVLCFVIDPLHTLVFRKHMFFKEDMVHVSGRNCWGVCTRSIEAKIKHL